MYLDIAKSRLSTRKGRPQKGEAIASYMAPGRARHERRAERAAARKARAKALSSSAVAASTVEQVVHSAQFAEEKGDCDTAIAMLEKALAIRSGDAQLYEELASLHMQAGRVEVAERALRRAIELRPDDGFEKYANLGQLLGNCDEALRMIMKGIDVLKMEAMRVQRDDDRFRELKAYEASAHCARAEICLGIIEDSNNPEIAKTMDVQVEKAVMEALALSEEGSETEIEAVVALANLRLSQGRREEAAVAMQRVLTRMADGLQMLESTDDGDHIVVEALKRLPPIEMRIAVAKQLVEVELLRPAIAVLGSVMWECDFNVEVWYLIAMAYWKLGEIGEAKDALESTRAVLRNPEGYDGQLDEEAIDKLWKKLDECAMTSSVQHAMQE